MRNTYLVICFVMIAAAATSYGLYEFRSAARQTVTSASAGSSKTKMAPDFALRTLDGRPVKLSDFRGKLVLLNFWATWCAPCRVEMPWFVEFYKRYQPQGLEIVGVSMDDAGQDSAIAEFVKERNVNYTILRGNNEVADLYGGLRFLPQTFFVDRDGSIVKTTFGIESKEPFEESIKQFINRKSAHR